MPVEPVPTDSADVDHCDVYQDSAAGAQWFYAPISKTGQPGHPTGPFTSESETLDAVHEAFPATEGPEDAFYRVDAVTVNGSPFTLSDLDRMRIEVLQAELARLGVR